jgi:hypothetical protein
MAFREKWFAVCTRDTEQTQWLEDTCSGGKWTTDYKRAKWWRSEAEAWAELEGADIDASELDCFEVRR